MLNSSAGASHEWPRGRKRWLPARALQSAVVDEDVIDDDDEQSNGTRFCLSQSCAHSQKRRYQDLFSVLKLIGDYSSRLFSGTLWPCPVWNGAPLLN